MYVRELRIRHLRRISDLTLKFSTPWTVLVGRSGTCKTSILQAVAMSSVGSLHVNGLVGRDVYHLVDRRKYGATMEVEAAFDVPTPGETARLVSRVTLRGDSSTIFGNSKYDPPGPRSAGDPLDLARSDPSSRWFVAGYGVVRALPDAATKPADPLPVDRVRSLFDCGRPLAGTSFANYDDKRSKHFERAFRAVMDQVGPVLGITDFNLRNFGEVRSARDLQDRHQFKLNMGGRSSWVPSVALSHGHQATISWLADLVGQVAASSKSYVAPDEVVGTVLLDEVFLHVDEGSRPQLLLEVSRAFPKLQFLATSRSDSGLSGHEMVGVIQLDVDPETGDAVVKE